MATSTANTTLSSSPDGTTYTKVCDIISYPDLGAAPNKLDTTTLSNTVMKTSILGLQDEVDLTFEANYDKTTYAAIKAMTTSRHFKLDFGAAGADGSFTWEGQIKVFVTGGGVDDVRKMTITISAETEIVAS